jgi:DNA-binding MarR family transcriptional regulator
MSATSHGSPTTAVRAPSRLPDELVASSIFLLKRLGTTVKSRALEAYEETGLGPYHHAVLSVLEEGSRETQGAIAGVLGYDPGQLVGLLDELEERGYVERKRDPHDRRRHIVQLTPDGARALERLRTLARRIEDDFFAPLDADERATLHALLLRLAQRHEPGCVGLVAPPD